MRVEGAGFRVQGSGCRVQGARFGRGGASRPGRLRSPEPRNLITSGRGTTRAEDAQGTPTQSHISASILEYTKITRS